MVTKGGTESWRVGEECSEHAGVKMWRRLDLYEATGLGSVLNVMEITLKLIICILGVVVEWG